MSVVTRWLWMGTLLAGAWAQASDPPALPARKVGGNLDERMRLQTVHSEMNRECGAAPASSRCHRLRREFQQEARNYEKHHHK